MKKKILSLYLVFSMLQLVVFSQNTAWAAPGVPISAPSAILLDASTQRIVFSKTPHQRRPPASTTKLLTAVLAVENLGLDRVVTIPRFVESIEPSKAYLRPGEQYRVGDLVRASLISSANDAAEVLAVAVAGSSPRFAGIMNQKARSLGAKRSHFVRASGLPARNQYSTAYDMALIMRAAQKYPFLVQALRTRSLVIQSLGGRKIYLKNHNKMLWRQNPVVVGKTGWTRKGRHCFAGQISVYAKKVVVVLLGSHRLWRDLRTLVNYQFGLGLTRIRENRKIWARTETIRIQTALTRAGFNPGPVDGDFGPSTVKAVEKFQAVHRLPSDGVVDSRTWRVLKRYL